MGTLLLILVGVVGVTVVGHGLWVLCARLLGILSGAGSSATEQLSPRARRLRDLDTAIRLLQSLRSKEQIDEEAATEVLVSLRERRNRMQWSEQREERPAPARRTAPPPKLVLELVEEPPAEAPAPAPEPPPPAWRPVEVASSPPETPPPPRRRLRPEPEPEPEPVPAAPRRSFAEMLAGFMEERNILWGELVGGLLIVGCSIALVLTLWQTLEKIPFFPFLIFSGINLALFGAGWYTFYRWRLRNTSRGLLVISMLLVPLNLLVLAGLAHDRGGETMQLLAALAGVGVSAAVVRVGGRAIAGPGENWLALGVVGAAAAQLLVPPMLTEASPAWLLPAFGCLPVACLAVAAWRRWLLEPEVMERPRVVSLLLYLGLTVFSTAVALGFFLARGQALGLDWHALALPVAAAGAPICVVGLALRRRVSGEEDGAARTAATAAALAGVAVLFGAVGVAWPTPLALLGVCLFNAGLLTFLAFRERMPWVHACALPCAAVAVGLVSQLATGRVGPWLADGEALLAALASASSLGAAAVLVPLAAGCAEWLYRRDERGHGRAFHVNALALGAVLLLASLGHGLTAPAELGWIYGVCGATSLAMTGRRRHRWLGQVGWLLLLGSTGWLLRAFLPERLDWWASTFAAEALMLALGALWHTEGKKSWYSAVTEGCQWLVYPAVALVAVLALCDVRPEVAYWQPYTPAALLATAALLVMAWAHRTPGLTAMGAAGLWAALTHFFVRDLPADAVAHPWMLALFVHATVVAVAGQALRWLQATPSPLSPVLGGEGTGVRGSEILAEGQASSSAAPSPPTPLPRSTGGEGGRDVERIYGFPLRLAGQVTSGVALAATLVVFFGALQPLGLYLLWVAGLWLAFAWLGQSRAWLAAGQTTLFASVSCLTLAVVGTAAPHGWQSWGLATAALCGGWLVVRQVARRSEGATRLLEGWLGVDRLMLIVLVVAQFLLPAVLLVGELPRELFPHDTPGTVIPPPSELVFALAGGRGWLLLGALAAVLLLALWDRLAQWAGVGLTVLALAGAVLVACWCSAIEAPTSALKWSLALVFVAVAGVLWCRSWLAGVAARLGIDTRWRVATEIRGVLLLGAALPILWLTFEMARMGFNGQQPHGPAPGTLFAELGVLTNNLGPLALLCLGLVGHAVRERSAGYAFGAGQLAVGTLVGGYALMVVLGGGAIDEPMGVRLLQLGTLGAGTWALGWLLVRPWVRAWRESPTGTPLMLVQCGLALAGAAVFLLWGGVSVIDRGLNLGPALPAGELGSPLGWLAAAVIGLAAAVRQRQFGRPLMVHGLITAAVAALVLGACDVAAFDHVAGYRTLMLGAAGLALLLSLGQFAEGRRLGWDGLPAVPGSPPVLPWITDLGLAAVVLALAVVAAKPEHVWAASAVAVASLAGVGLAPWRREEGWVLGWGLGFNLAATLLVWHFAFTHDGHFVLLWTTQANLATSAVVALGWLAGQRQLLKRPDERWSPLVTLQTVPVVAGQVALLLLPLVVLLLRPSLSLPEPLHQLGMPGGWLTLALVMAAGYGYAARWLPAARVGVLGVGGLAVCVLAATVADFWAASGWHAYHTLTAGVALFGCGCLTLANRKQEMTDQWGWMRWVEAGAAGLMVLAARVGFEDPWRPWATVGAALLVATLVGALVPRTRSQVHVGLSGLALVAAGGLLWLWHGYPSVNNLLLLTAITLSLGSLLWLALSRVWLKGTESLLPPYPHLAAAAAVVLVGFVAAERWGGHVFLGLTREADALTLPACGAVAVALAAHLWERRGWFAVPGLYVLTLCTTLLLLDQFFGPAVLLQRASVVAAAGLVLAWALLSWGRRLLGRYAPIQLRVKSDQPWFVPLQVGIAAAATLASLWLCNAPAPTAARLLAPLALGLLILAGVAMTLVPRLPWQVRLLHIDTLGLGVLALVELGWALIEPAAGAPLLHRVCVVLVAVTGAALAYRALAGLAIGDWRGPCRVFGNHMPFVGWATLLLLMALEVGGYDALQRVTPLDGLEVAQAAGCMVVLLALALRWALVPELDPLGTRLDGDGRPRGRTLYVYVAELFLVFLFLHLKLNVPWLFSQKMGHYWTFIVMMISFAGVALGEHCRRRRLEVLGGPLQRSGFLLPLLPLVGFWVRPPGFVVDAASAHSPGLVPMLNYLTTLPQHFHEYAALWVMLGATFAMLSVWRRSTSFALLAALAANVGLWSLLGHFDLALLVHPQMWLIPLALIGLAAEHLNRDHLTPRQSLGLRYGALLLIYVSSTANLFISGLGNSAWPPVVLAALCVAGVLAGVLLRVRAFLYLGTAFLCVDVFAMIWHAARDREQTWVWYVSGIVLGTLILAVFAVFEKRREDVLHLLERLRAWD